MLIGLVAPSAAQGPTVSGSLVLNTFGDNPGESRIERFRLDGTHVWTSTGGTGTSWVGCALTQSGRVVTTRLTPQHGVNFFDASGAQVAEFAVQPFYMGDVDVFADGTLAVVNRNGGVRLYSEAGALVGSMTPAGSSHPLGCYVDRHDQLWLCDLAGKIQKLDRAGQLLQTILPLWIPRDMVVAPDDTLWVGSGPSRRVMHFDPAGVLLGSFPVAVGGSLTGIALDSGGTLYVTGDTSTSILRYSSTGTLLGSFPIPAGGGTPQFMTIIECGDAPTSYCTAKLNSVGCLPAIAAQGSVSASATSGFTVSASNVRNQKTGLLIYSLAGRNSAPFQGGFLCVALPVSRTPGTSSGGTALPASDCSGVYAIDMNAYARGLLGGNPLPGLTVAGTRVDCQWWGRDPGFPAPENSTLSNGLEYIVCP